MNFKDNRGNSDIGKLFRIILFAVILIVGGKYVYEHYIKITDITNDLKLSESQLSAKYGTIFKDDPKLAQQVPQYSNPDKNVITVRTDGTFDVIYANGEQIGVGTAGKRFLVYNVKWGDIENDIYDKISFPYDETFFMLSENIDGHTTTSFFFNRHTNEGMAYVRNNVSDGVIYMAYYTDMKRATETIW